MRALQFTLLFAVAEAAKIKWTLHKSCFEGTNSGLEKPIVDSVKAAKKWASNAASKIGDSAIKDAIGALVGESQKEITDNFKKIADLEDNPTGAPKYWRSDEWLKMESKDDHWTNFIITCSPDIVQVKEPDEDPANPNPNPSTVPYDVVRKDYQYQGHDFEKWIEQLTNPGDWTRIPPGPLKVKALTQRDTIKPVAPSGRLRVAQSINFHPLWIRYQQSKNFGTWTQELYDEVTAGNAWEKFLEKGKERKVDIRPVDGLLTESFVANVLHELFHLTAFGDMLDRLTGDSYGWAHNVRNKDSMNPDLYAIIGAVVQLANQDGNKYLVDKDGRVVPKK